MFFLTYMLVYIRIAIDYIINFCFGFYYGSKKETIPQIKESFLLESATSIANKIRKRELSSEQIVRAFIDRCEEVNGITNSITDNRFELAIEEAKKIDKDLSENKYSEQQLKNKPFLGNK